MKKLFTVLGFLVIASMIFTACSSAEEAPVAEVVMEEETMAEEAPAEEAPAQLTFGFTANNATADNNQGKHYQELERYGKEKGINMVMLDAAGDPTTQISQIENLIQMKVDVIIIRATNATAIVPAMKKAYEAGIPVIVTTNIVDESGWDYMTAFVGPSDELQAKAAAQILIDYYKDSTKETINILEVSHVPGTTVSTLRAKGFREAIEGTNFQILDSQTAEGKRENGQQITEAWLLKYAPGEIDGIFVQGTGMGFGVLNAIAAADRVGEFPVVFIATGAESFDKIKAGELYGSVDQSPIVEAQLTIDTAVRVVNGEEVDFLTYLPISVTTQENIDTAERPTW